MLDCNVQKVQLSLNQRGELHGYIMWESVVISLRSYYSELEELGLVWQLTCFRPS